MLRLALAATLAAALSWSASAQQTNRVPHVLPLSRGSSTSAKSGLTPTEQAFNRARAAGPLALRAFLLAMPKGADLHMHLSGAVYAETFLAEAVADRLCVATARMAFVLSLPSPDAVSFTCPDGAVPVETALTSQPLYDALIDAFSMRAFVPGAPGPAAAASAHDQFFASFARYSGLNAAHRAEWLDEVATRAAAQNEQYLEIMHTPVFARARTLGNALGWPATPVATTAGSSTPPDAIGASPAELAALREKLLAGGLRAEVASGRAEYAEMLATRRKLEHCDDPAQALPACAVQIRFLVQVLRAAPPQVVFAQTLLAFELADAEAGDPHANIVGLNFVQPEDAYRAMTEYHRQMLMLQYLHSVYPRVHLSLHAGELAEGLVPPAGLAFHIREAVELAGAERIGHGVDVMQEREAAGLLAEMARKHVAVEINLTSNDVILGVTAPRHPLPAYLTAGVPVALSTDDEGVSRIDLTHEYVRAVLEYGLTYADLKRIARTSLEHSFLPGASLWNAPDDFTLRKAACVGGALGTAMPPNACQNFLAQNPRAAAESDLEHRFLDFDTTFSPSR